MNKEQFEKRNLQICFTPALLPFVDTDENTIAVIVDVLRATTAICAAFDNGVKEIIPVATLDEAETYKKNGYLIAAERDGIKASFADFGNSPFNFRTEEVKGKTIVYSTTNGTQVIGKAAEIASEVAIGAFINLNALCDYLIKKNKNVIIICAGWKMRFNLEDTVCAGAIADVLLKSGSFVSKCDSVAAATELWNVAKNNLISFADKCAHRHRLKKLGLDDVIEYSFTLDAVDVIPVLKNNTLIKSEF